MPLAPNSAVIAYQAAQASFPRLTLPDGRLITQPVGEWISQQLRWRWLLDTWEGGETFRMAIYGYDIKGLPVRNLIRHKREYPSAFDPTYSLRTGRPVGTDSYHQAEDDDYERRRARGPIPTFLAETIETHLSTIYSSEVKRNACSACEDWWEDVDGCGTSIDQWMIDTGAPLLLVFGQLDLIVDHPPAPTDILIKSQRDVIDLQLDKARLSYILPENIPWYNLNPDRTYKECLVREVDDNGISRWRYWNAECWALYDALGKIQTNETLARGDNLAGYTGSGAVMPDPEETNVVPHPYGRVPIIRLFDRRRARYKFVGLPRYESIAENSREHYNRDSELILSDTIQAFPLVQCPEDYIQPDGTLPIGPSYFLPKKKNSNGASVSYEGFDVLDFPKGAADSLRTNLDRIRDSVDRLAGLTKPAGAAGTTGQTVSQSGISKRLDSQTGNRMLGNIAQMLARNEKSIAQLALCVLADGRPSPADLKSVDVQYPRKFDLFSIDELSLGILNLQMMLMQTGAAPVTESIAIVKYVKELIPGLDDEDYAEIEEEIRAHIGMMKKLKIQQAGEGMGGAGDDADSDDSDDSDEADVGDGNQGDLGEGSGMTTGGQGGGDGGDGGG